MNIKLWRSWGLGVAAALVMSLGVAPSAWAWGPERPTYTVTQPADHAVFNSITDNPAVGNEMDFVRIVEKGTNGEYVSDLTIEPGKQYEVYIYYHNDAASIYNRKEYNYIGAARETKLASSFPASLAKDEVGMISGVITSTTTNPGSVWDEAYVKAKEALTLHYVNGSAKIYNDWPVSGSVLSRNLFSTEGTYIGLTELNGLIPGCDAYSGSIVYTLQAIAVDTPEDPDNPDPVDPDPVDPDPDDPDPVDPDPSDPDPVVPTELPKTGPIEIALAIIVTAAIVAGIVYWNKTHKEVRRMTKKAKGRK